METEHGAIINARLRGKLKQAGLRLTNPIAAGDRVILSNQVDEEGNHVIDEISKRTNYISRKSTNLSKEMQILAANIDLYTKVEADLYKILSEMYERIGYPCYQIQSTDKNSLEFLKKLIQGKQVMLGGNSGVGKSSIVNA